MSDEVKTETVEEKKEEVKQEAKTEKVEVKTPEELQVELETLKRSLQNKTEEAIRVHEKLDKYEKVEQEKRDAELSEIEKLQKQIDEKTKELETTQSELEQMKLNEKKREVAQEIGLPPAFALRIQGATPEEMKADAQALLDAMPKGKSLTSLTNPDSNLTSKNETDAQRAKRLGLY